MNLSKDIDLSKLYEHAPIAMVLLDRQLNVHYANAVALEILNMTHHETGLPNTEKRFNHYLNFDSLAFFEWLGNSNRQFLDCSIYNGLSRTSVRLYQQPVEELFKGGILLAVVPFNQEQDNTESLKFYKRLFENVNFGLLIMDGRQMIQHANHAFLQMLGYQIFELKGKPFEGLLKNSYSSEFCVDMKEYLNEETFWNGRLINTTREGTEQAFDVEIVTIFDTNQKHRPVKFYVAFYRQIEGMHKASSALNHQAYMDLLTEIPNRLGFLRQLEARFEAAQRSGDSLSLMLIDIKHFKQVNAFFGHEYGDELLAQFTQRLKHSLGANYFVGRFEGDQFAIIINGAQNDFELGSIAEGLIADLTKPYLLFDVDYSVSLGIGCATYPQHGITVSNLIASTEAALNQSKMVGKNTFYLFNSSSYEQSVGIQMQTDLQIQAVKNEAIQLRYEPIYELKSGKVNAFFITPVWHENDELKVLDAELIEVWGGYTLLSKFSELMLSRLFNDLSKWKKLGKTVKVIMPVIPQQLEGESFKSHIQKMQRHFMKFRVNVSFSIPESLFFPNTQEAMTNLDWLYNDGFNLLLDGYGSADSKIDYLEKFELEGVCFDQALIEKITDVSILSPDRLQAFMAMSEVLQIPTYAKGIESSVQHSYLNAVGCDYVRGPLFHEPVLADEVLTLLSGK